MLLCWSLQHPLLSLLPTVTLTMQQLCHGYVGTQLTRHLACIDCMLQQFKGYSDTLPGCSTRGITAGVITAVWSDPPGIQQPPPPSTHKHSCT